VPLGLASADAIIDRSHLLLTGAGPPSTRVSSGPWLGRHRGMDSSCQESDLVAAGAFGWSGDC
jgi:hypothetical protein